MLISRPLVSVCVSSKRGCLVVSLLAYLRACLVCLAARALSGCPLVLLHAGLDFTLRSFSRVVRDTTRIHKLVCCFAEDFLVFLGNDLCVFVHHGAV